MRKKWGFCLIIICLLFLVNFNNDVAEASEEPSEKKSIFQMNYLGVA